MKAKILLVHPEFYFYGGAERQIVQLANYLTDHNYFVSILTSKVVPELNRDLKEARIINVRNQKRLFQTIQAIAHKYNIINPHNHPVELFIYPKRIPTIWQCNEPPIQILSGGDINPKEKEFIKNHIVKAIVITDYDKKRFKKIYGFDPIINYPGVRYSYFNKKIKPKDPYKLKNKFVILEFGMLTFTKNQLKLVEIFNEVKKKIKNAKLVLAGYDGLPYKYDVQMKIQDLGLEDDVIITGEIKTDEEVRDLYNICDLYVAPMTDQGGWATTFEALVTGMPIVISDTTVFASLVEDNNLGHVVKIKDFANKIVNIYNNYEEEKKKTKQAAKFIRDNLTWDKFGERYAKIFDEIYEDK